MIWNDIKDKLTLAITGGDQTASTNLIPDIIRLIEDPDIKKEIAFDEISLDEAGNESEKLAKSSVKSQENTAGAMFPLIRINDYIFAARNIKKMQLSCTDFIPTISVQLYMSENNFIDKSMPKDGDILSLYMRSSTNALEFVRCDFIISGFSSKAKESNSSSMDVTCNINGMLFIPRFNATAINTYAYIGTSREVLRKIAQEFHLGFAFNDSENSTDMQNWIACNQSMTSYINSLMAHSWKNETSFFQSWIDIYYNIVYVNVNEYFLNSDVNEEFDITFFSTSVKNLDEMENDPDVNKASAIPKVLTNMKEYRGTPMYITRWTPVNNSTSISMSNGYSVDTYTFLHNQHILSMDLGSSFNILNNIPAYDPSKTDSHILLRGRARYDENKNPEDEKARVNYDFVHTYIKKTYTGIDYVKGDNENDSASNNTWSGNVHLNYGRAPYHNSINLNELNKMYIIVECEGLNLQVQRGEYVPVYIAYDSKIEMDINNLNNSTNEAALPANRTYTGYYYVSDVTYNYKYGEEESLSNFSTVFTLKRREWPTPEKIIKDE